VSDTAKSIPAFEHLLELFRQLPEVKTPSKTFLGVSRFPHSELACSNILAFFLDPKEEHGFDVLVLKSLLTTVRPDLTTLRLQSVTIKREDRTDSNKSMDLVVLGDSFVVGIENKIYAEVYNPFEEYNKRLDEIAKEHQISEQNIVRILLSLRPEPTNLFGFQPVTYEKFLSIVRNNIGPTIGRADHRWLSFLIDFISTIESLGGLNMDKNFIDFAKANKADLLRLYSSIGDLNEFLHEEVDKVAALIKLPSQGYEGRLKPYENAKGEGDFFHRIYIFANAGQNLKISVETTLYLSRGWTITCWCEDQKRASNWLASHGIIPESTNNGWVYKSFEEQTPIETVKNKFQELLDRIGAAIQQKR
jgi:hypothetical protein